MILVITHANEHVACFTAEPDGSVKQQALINTGTDAPTPTELAHLGQRLADEFQWDTNGNGRKRKALPPGKRKPGVIKQLHDTEQRRNGTQRRRGRPYDQSDMAPELRGDAVMAYLREHPDSSASEIVSGLGMEPTHQRIGRWHHIFVRLRTNGQILPRETNEHGRRVRYSLA